MCRKSPGLTRLVLSRRGGHMAALCILAQGMAWRHSAVAGRSGATTITRPPASRLRVRVPPAVAPAECPFGLWAAACATAGLAAAMAG